MFGVVTWWPAPQSLTLSSQVRFMDKIQFEKYLVQFTACLSVVQYFCLGNFAKYPRNEPVHPDVASIPPPITC